MPEFSDDNGNQSPREPRGSAARGRGATYAGGGGQSPQEGAPTADRPYTVYRSAPRSLTARLRGETDAELEARAEQLSRQQPQRGLRGSGAQLDQLDPKRGARGSRPSEMGSGPGGPGGPGSRPPLRGWRRIPGLRPSRRPPLHPLRLLKYLVLACVAWVLLSAVLFFVSASSRSGNLPGGSATEAALSSAGPILFSPNNILVVGLDTRPKTGYSSKEGGASYSETTANTDTLMIWRVGGGVSRKLSVPRDTLVDVPGRGLAKINSAWATGGPKETIQVVEKLTGLKINHMIVVDLGNFVKFINDIGGVTVNTPRICSKISGGAADGGYTLNLSPGSHHLDGVDAVTLARTRDNSCNLAWTDINREKMQQQIMNGIKSQLFTPYAFIHLPWASWDAPGAIQTDMGGLSLMQLFVAAEIGGSSAAQTLKESGGYYGSQEVLRPNAADVRAKVQQLINGK